MEDQQKRSLRQIGKGKEEAEDNERDYGQRYQLPAKQRPEFAVRDEVVDALEGIEKGRADDVANWLEGGCGNGAYIWHVEEEERGIRGKGGGGRGIEV